jgi:A/G-specific adenine glycosylase
MPPRLKSKKTDMPSPQARDLLAWYDRHRRRMPWRALPGVSADPYAVWLSEIMLQQTTVTAVKPYFETFLARWPTVEALSAAPVADVMAAWAGLGYYARARNLYKCAGVVAAAHGGRFPSTEAELLELPGVGPYTAAAIAAIAFDRVATVVDGNVERVMARLFAVTAPLPGSKARLKELAAGLTPPKRAGDYAQGVMDLGATVCTPKSPKCMICPWAENCRGRILGIAETLPRKAPKAESPQRYGVAFWMERKDGGVFLQRRPDKGLLGGMMEIPSTPWRGKTWGVTEASAAAPIQAAWRELDGVVTHVFTHFRLDLKVFAAQLTPAQTKALKGEDAAWVQVDRMGSAGLPSVMAKVAKHALKNS